MDHRTAPDARYGTAPGVCPFTIDRPVMRQRWERLSFLHWPYDAESGYLCHRRWPGPRPASSRVRVSTGEPAGPSGASERDHFLTARWRLFSVRAGRLISARACHQPWPLYRATAPLVDDHLLTAAGLPEPLGEPLVHYSPGVDVAIGPPEFAQVP
jgi:uncharacterized protein YqjF (DUF2071 family)